MEEELEIAQEILQEILGLMQIPAEVISRKEEERVHLEIKSDQGALLIGKRGRGLDALQTICGIIISKKLNRKVYLEIDTENYRERHRQQLINLAEETANKVRSTGTKENLPPMSASERRIIHLALKDASDIVTFSEGEGDQRYIVISPKE